MKKNSKEKSIRENERGEKHRGKIEEEGYEQEEIKNERGKKKEERVEDKML